MSQIGPFPMLVDLGIKICQTFEQHLFSVNHSPYNRGHPCTSTSKGIRPFERCESKHYQDGSHRPMFKTNVRTTRSHRNQVRLCHQAVAVKTLDLPHNIHSSSSIVTNGRTARSKYNQTISKEQAQPYRRPPPASRQTCRVGE